MSYFVRHEPCPKCGSKDNVAVYSNGFKKCFSVDCGYKCYGDNESIIEEEDYDMQMTKSISIGTIKAIPDRKIEEDTCRRYGAMLNGTKHFYPYYDKEGNHIANKVRNIENKTFFSEGNIKGAMLFGQKSFQEG